jgi:hypothetical protein
MVLVDCAVDLTVRLSPTAAQLNDLRNTPRDAITMKSISRRRRAAFGRNSLITGAKKPDPVTGRRPQILQRPYLPVRTHGIDLYI